MSLLEIGVSVQAVFVKAKQQAGLLIADADFDKGGYHIAAVLSTISNGPSSSFAIVEIQCSAKPSVAMDLSVRCLRGHSNDQSVFETLMVAFCVIVVHVLGHSTS